MNMLKPPPRRTSRSVAGQLFASLLLVLLAAALVCRPEPAQAQRRDRREISLSPGEQKILPGEGVSSISTGSPGIIQVRVTDDQKQVVVVGMAPGTTTLLMLMQSGERADFVVTVTNLQPRRNIRLDVYFVQLSRRRGMQLGVAWPGSIGAAISAQATVDQTGSYVANAAATSQLIPQLDFARTRGWAKVLDHARLVVANGDTGTYSSSGELNARVSGAFSADLRQINFGTNVTCKVTYDDVTGRLEGSVKAEVSKLQGAGVDQLPSRNIIKIDTIVNLEVGQSLALGGLFSDEETAESNGLPLFSEIPIIGYLFGTHGQREERNENVVFIVPSLVGAVSLEQRDRVAEALELWKKFEGERPQGGAIRRLSADRVLRPPTPKVVPLVPPSDVDAPLPPPPKGGR